MVHCFVYFILNICSSCLGGEYGYQRLGGDSVFYNTSFAGMGMLGSQLPPSKNKTHWKTGTNVTVAWGPRYNHGGGYQYRLCPANETLTEGARLSLFFCFFVYFVQHVYQ